MGHINFDNLIQINKKLDVRDLPPITKPTRYFCKECKIGKEASVNFKTKEYSTTRPSELVHTELCGPTRTKILHGEYHFIFFVDDFTRMTWVSFPKKHSKAFKKLRALKELVENEIDRKIKCLQSDNGGEFTSGEFGSFYEECGIKRQFSVARTPQQNGVVEEKN